MSTPWTLADMNHTELASIVRRTTGVIVRRSVTRERLIELITNQQMPTAEEISDTSRTRRMLQQYIEVRWPYINSQLPCKGENRGKCTIYPCPEGRHMDCFTGNQEDIRIHVKVPDEP
jgi:hypothetical protein